MCRGEKTTLLAEWVANCGVMLTMEATGIRILVDGIFGSTPYFSPLPVEMKKACFGMGGRFRHIDHLLFTHRHEDHFHAGLVKSYLRENRVKTLTVPAPGADARSLLEDRGSVQETAAYCHLQEPCLSEGDEICFSLSEPGIFDVRAEETKLKARYICCRHLDWKTYPSVCHCAIEVSAGSRHLLFLADASPEDTHLEKVLQTGDFDAVFVTPLFYLDPRGRRMLRHGRPKQVVLYHVPFSDSDPTGLRPLAAKLCDEHAEEGNPVLFSDPRQRLLL